MKAFKKLVTVIAMLTIALSAVAQNVTIKANQVRLETVLEQITSQTGYSFVHSRPAVNPDQLVTLEVSDVSLEAALQKLFAGTSIVYEIQDKKVYLKEKSLQANATPAKKKINGVVVDDAGLPVIGAGVVIKGTTRGASTGIDGEFSLEASAKETLVFSSIGYDTVEILVGNQTEINVTMRESSMMLDDVVVIGYGAVKKRDVSTAISSIKAEDIANHPISDFRQAMVGKMPGVSVMQTGGDPEGSNIMVRVRGIGSATAGNDPLYVIDGVPVEDGLSNLNANDIESMEVLKDASSAAIYGSRGSNGVILITTKKGASDKLKVSYDGYYAWDIVSKKLPMMDAYEYAQTVKEAHDNAYYDAVPGGTDPNGSRSDSWANYPVEIIPYLEGQPGLTNTNWQDQIFRTAGSTGHNLSFSGKTNAINYFISANFLMKDGIIINSDFRKYALRFNLDGKHGRFRYGVNFAPSYSRSHRVNASGAYGNGGVVQSALAYNPMWPVYNEDGSFNFLGNGYWRIGNDYQHNEILNPVALATLVKDVVDRVSMTGRIFASFEIIDGLTIQTSLGGSYYGANNEKYTSENLETLGKANYGKKSNPIGYSSSAFHYNWLWENQLTYNKTINNDHVLNAILVHSLQKESDKSMNVTATDYPNDYIQTISGGTVSKGGSGTNEWSLASILARIQYSYKSKYMFSAAIRADGSSRFGKNHRWGFFPSVSAAWRISGEDFMEGTRGWLNDLKLRASYGQTGNFQIGNYTHLATLDTDNYILGANGGSQVSGYKPTGVENPDLTWEKTGMANIGLDANLWNGYLTLTAEGYYSMTTDMLLEVPIPHLTGYSTTLMNIGKVNNRGVELQLGSSHSYSSGFGYSFSANFSKNINEVKALGANDTPIIKSGSVAHAYYITEVGKPIGSYYLMTVDGVFKNQDELNSYPHFANTQPGDFRFVDVDGDGEIDLDKDRSIVGNYMPDFTYGFGGSLDYKGFDLQFAFQGVYGNEILNLNRRYLDNMEGNVNGTIAARNRWVSEANPGDGLTNRANRKQKGNNGRTSTWHIEDGSYLRLQNLALGYTIPARLTQKIHLSKVRFYVSAQNLFTLTNYSGYNPEVSNRTSALTPGEDYGTYPLARTFMAGVNLTF